MFVGDGANDLPALASADVSVATLETTDLVKANADVLLLTRRLGALVDFLRLGARSRQISFSKGGFIPSPSSPIEKYA